jgi:hypothetical protein
MYAVTLMLKRIHNGWALALSDGREIARFRGFGARRRALRYLATYGQVPQRSHAG